MNVLAPSSTRRVNDSSGITSTSGLPFLTRKLRMPRMTRCVNRVNSTSSIL